MYGRRGFSHKTSIQNEHLFIIFHPVTHVLRNKPLLWLSENSKMNYHVHFCFSKLYTEKNPASWTSSTSNFLTKSEFKYFQISFFTFRNKLRKKKCWITRRQIRNFSRTEMGLHQLFNLELGFCLWLLFLVGE